MHFWISVTIQSKLPKETDYGELISHTVGDFHLVLIAWSHFTGILKQTYALRFYNRLSTPARKSVSASCVRTCSDCPLPHCPPLPYHADKSIPAMSTLDIPCWYVHSCKFSVPNHLSVVITCRFNKTGLGVYAIHANTVAKSQMFGFADSYGCRLARSDLLLTDAEMQVCPWIKCLNPNPNV